jgi:hypothetical protein
MNRPRTWIIPVLLTYVLPVTLFGCSVARVLFQEQEWSDNYVRYPGAECSNPGLADGDTVSPVETSRQVIITLPKRFSINKIILKNKNIKDFRIYTSLGPDEWKEIGSVKNDRNESYELKVFTVTDRLMFRFGETTDDSVIPGQLDRQTGLIRPHLKLGIPLLAEIEVYGYKEAEPKGEDLIF